MVQDGVSSQHSRSGSVNQDGRRGRLYFCVGLPHSGKSTFCNRWVRCANVADAGDSRVLHPRVVVGGDDFRYGLHGREYLPEAEAMVFSVMDTAVLALLRRGFDVLVDETSTSKPTLMRYLRLDPAAEPVFVDTPAEVCKARALANGRPYLVRVIDRLAPRLDTLRADWPRVRRELLEQVEHRMTEDVVKV